MGKLPLLIACLFSLVDSADAAQAETSAQRRERVHSPIRSPYDGNVSLEWAIDASDAIVQARLDAERQLQQGKVHKQPQEIKISWPAGDPRRLRAICELYEPGDKIVFFLWHDTKEKSWRIFDYIPLISEEILKERLRVSQTLLPPLDQSQKQMYHVLRERDAGLTWLAIDKTGKWIGDNGVILDRITQRVKAGSRVPRGTDRQAVLDGKSELGGFYVHKTQEPEVSSAEFPVVLVPPDPEYREGYLKIVRNLPSHQGQLPAFPRIINYKDAEVIEALKMRLTDDLVNEVWYKLPGRKQVVGNTYYFLKPDDPPLKPMPDMEGARIYVIRRAAWKALRQMGEHVDPPDFNVK